MTSPTREASASSDMYQPLRNERREIRLIKVTPPELDDDLNCVTDIFSLDDQIKYTALSYRWTTEQPSCTIRVSNSSFSVRPNLYSILRTLRDESFTDWIFIDAICINQDDLIEKATQVSMMGELYSKASQTISWVSTKPLTADTNDLLSPYCADRLNREQVVQFREQGKQHELRTLRDTVVDVFVDWEYWSRLWIVQEIVLSDNLIIRSGQAKIHAEIIYYVLKMVNASETDRRHDAGILLRNPSMCTSPTLRRGMYCFAAWRILELQQGRLRGAQKKPFTDTFALCGSQDCLDRHDKVFGLLGISNLHLVPDYRMPIIELYLRVLNEGLYMGPALDIGSKDEADHRGNEQENTTEQEPASKKQIDRSLDLAALVAFGMILTTALDLPFNHPLIILLTRETLARWGIMESFANLQSLTTILTLASNKWVRAKEYLKMRQARLLLYVWRCTTRPMPELSDMPDRRSYAAWCSFAEEIFQDVRNRMDTDVEVSRDFKEWLEEMVSRTEQKRSIGTSLRWKLGWFTVLFISGGDKATG